jgi:hypothetical protein
MHIEKNIEEIWIRVIFCVGRKHTGILMQLCFLNTAKTEQIILMLYDLHFGDVPVYTVLFSEQH